MAKPELRFSQEIFHYCFDNECIVREEGNHKIYFLNIQVFGFIHKNEIKKGIAGV